MKHEAKSSTQQEGQQNSGDSSRIRKNSSTGHSNPRVDHFMSLQRTIGNQAVQRLLNHLNSEDAPRTAPLAEQSQAAAPHSGVEPQAEPASAMSGAVPGEAGQATLSAWRASSDLWYFNGEPHGSPLPTEVTLEADARPQGHFLWSVTEGANKVELGGGDGTSAVMSGDNRVGLKSKGGSDGTDDVSVRVSHLAPDGTPTATYEGKLGVRNPVGTRHAGENTIHYQVAPQIGPRSEQPPATLSPAVPGSLPDGAPKSLSPKGSTHAADATWAYLSRINYEVLDDKGAAIKGFDVNEKFTTGTVNDVNPCDWRQSTEGGYTSTTTTFADMIGGESTGHTPAPTNPKSPLGTTKVQHWSQEWFIGSTTPGKGTKVQTNTFQKYMDHGAHENIKSPP